MNTISNISFLFVGLGTLIYTGAILFTGGALTPLGWSVIPVVFVGSAGVVAVHGKSLFISAKQALANRKARKAAEATA